jgi:thiamine biosynthesis protein ThiC
MKNRELIALLQKYDPEAEVKVRAAAIAPKDWEDVSEDDELIEDGELLEITDNRSLEVFVPGEIHIVADKVFEA